MLTVASVGHQSKNTEEWGDRGCHNHMVKLVKQLILSVTLSSMIADKTGVGER